MSRRKSSRSITVAVLILARMVVSYRQNSVDWACVSLLESIAHDRWQWVVDEVNSLCSARSWIVLHGDQDWLEYCWPIDRSLLHCWWSACSVLPCSSSCSVEMTMTRWMEPSGNCSLQWRVHQSNRCSSLPMKDSKTDDHCHASTMKNWSSRATRMIPADYSNWILNIQWKKHLFRFTRHTWSIVRTR